MAKVKYAVKENKKFGTHSFYAVPVVNGSLSFNEVVEEACRNTSIEPSFMAAAVKEYMKAVQTNVLKGFRVPVGESFLFVYPNIQSSVKDYTDKQTGKTVVATADMVTARGAKSRLGASVAPKFSQEFAQNVSWQRTDASGAAVEEPDDVTDNEETQTQGDSAEQPAATGPVLTVTNTGAGSFTLTNQTGQTVESGATVPAGHTLTLRVTAAGSATPTATIGGQTVTLVEDEGRYVGTFLMPSANATLTVKTGGSGDNEE